MNEQELGEIKTRANATWPGPWKWDEEGFLHSVSVGSEVPFEEVREFIAHARSDIPRLVAEMERLQRENGELRAYIEEGMRGR